MKKLSILDELENEIINCSKCPRLRAVNPFPMPHICYSKTLDNIEIFCIGRNPGLEDSYAQIERSSFMEHYREKWWICRVGKYLRGHLGDDIVKNKLFFSNICKCSSPKNSVLTDEEKSNCFPFLLRQIEIVQPKIIITISSDAFKALNLHSYPFEIPVVDLYHPSYLVYSDNVLKSKVQNRIFNHIKECFQ